MSRKGMPKKGKGTPSETADTSTVDDTGTPEIFGGVEEHTIGKDEVPIFLTRTDPNFEDREKLAEKLWEQEKDNFVPVTGGDAEEGADREEKSAEAEEAVEAKPEEGKEDEGDAEEDEEAAESEELIVDGEKIVKTKAEIEEAGGKRNLQKILAADKRLEEATLLLRQAQATVQAQLPGQGAASQREPQPVSQEQGQKIKALYEKLRYGDDDEGQEAMQELLQGRTATPVDKQEILQAVEQMFYGYNLAGEKKRIQAVFTTAPDQGGYADIYPEEMGGKSKDPEMWEFFDYKINQLVNAGEPQELATYQKAADAVRKRFGAGTTQQDSLADKRERKRGIDVVQGVKTKTPGTPQVKADTHDDIIKWHQKERGQL